MVSWLCTLCTKSLALPCSESCARADDNDCPLTTGWCGHTFHFHCIAAHLKRVQGCPADGITWEFIRVGTRFQPTKPEDYRLPTCHEVHRELSHLIGRYRVVRVAGKYDPASYALLSQIHDHLIRLRHPFAWAMGYVIKDLPQGGMMINLDIWDWLFRFLDKLLVTPLGGNDLPRIPALVEKFRPLPSDQ